MLAPYLPVVAIQGDVTTTTARQAQIKFLEPTVLCAVAVGAETAVAAHATNVFTCTVYNRKADDSGTIAVATLTNDTDVASSAAADSYTDVKVVKSGAVGSNVPLVANLASKDNALIPALGNGYKKLAGAKINSGDVLEVHLVGSAGLSLDEATVVLYIRPGTS